MADFPVTAEVLGDPEALKNHKRQVFEKIEIRKPRGGYRIYKPHRYQKAAHFPGKPLTHQMLACGRRGGKTQFDIAEALAMMAIDGTVTWVGAPSYKLTDRVFQPLYRALVIEKIFGVSPVRERNSSAERYVEMPWGAIVEGKSAERPDSAKGASLDLFIDDECAEHGEEFFTEYVDAGLADREGKAIFSSTPMGLTWFHKYFKRGEHKRQHPTWQSHTWTSEDNPFLSKDWLKRKRGEVSDTVWRQEYLAEFLARAGLIWEDYRDEYWDRPGGGHLFNPDTHPVDPSWTWYRGGDIGTNHPTGWVWGAVDPQNNIWVDQEYFAKASLHQEHAQAVAAQTIRPVTNSFISWEANTGDGKGGETVLQIYQQSGIYCQLAPKDLELRVDAVSAYMRSTLQDASPHPKIFISDRCTALRDQIKKYRHKDMKPDTEAGRLKPHRKGKGDDLCDALGHLCVTKPGYAPAWVEEAGRDSYLERYGYQDSTFARDYQQRDQVIGIPGLATVPDPGATRW